MQSMPCKLLLAVHYSIMQYTIMQYGADDCTLLIEKQSCGSQRSSDGALTYVCATFLLCGLKGFHCLNRGICQLQGQHQHASISGAALGLAIV